MNYLPALRAVAQENLDQVGAAVVEGDFDAFVEHVSLPFVGVTARGLQCCETVDALRSAFQKTCAAYRAIGVTRVDAAVDTVLPIGEAGLMRTHVARLWKDDTLLRPPHSGISVLDRATGGWRLRRAQYALKEPSKVGMGFDATMPVSPEGEEDRAIVVSVLNAVTRALLQGDFDSLRRAVRLPFFLQGPDGTRVFSDFDALRDAFDQRVTEIRSHEVTDMMRMVKTVRRTSDDRIQGFYRTHVLSGQTLVAPSFVSVMTLEHDADGHWRAGGIMHPMGPLRLARASAPPA